MRALAVAALLLAAPTAAAAQAVTLGELAGDLHNRALPADVAAAPEGVMIDAALRDLLLAQPLDGGREQSVYLRFDPAAGSLAFDRAIPGERYRATGRCDDCDYPRPVQVHTHPYENPFSVVDLIIAGRTGTASLMVARDGRLWLAVPTGGSYGAAVEEWREFRYALFGNRLQCPARTPPGGWASATPMARNVEIVARAAAHDLKVALYMLAPGQTRFRKLADFDHGERLFHVDQPVALADLNAWEMALLRTLSMTGRADAAAFDPRTPAPELAAALAGTDWEDDPPAVRGAPRIAANLAVAARLHWFRPLPTTVYRQPFQDLSSDVLPFTSVQWSGDCASLMVLQGEQAFAPDGVRYSGGWKRPAQASGAWSEGWVEMAPAEFPTGQVVPW